MILNGIHDISVTVLHLNDLVLLQETDEDVLAFRSYSTEHTGLVALQPAPITSDLDNLQVASSAGNRRIRKLAVEQSRILERLIVANSRLQQDIYSILTAEQRQKLDSRDQETVDVITRLK